MDESQLEPRRLCGWCGDDIPPWTRRDAETCSKACRQRRHRFRVGPAAPALGRPMRFAYADPPYPGLARRYYGCDEVDHGDLIRRLVCEFPDGWALSTSADALDDVLVIIRDIVDCFAHGSGLRPRIAVWVKGSRRSVSHRPRNAWEPVIVMGGRPVELQPQDALDDVLVWGGRQHTHPGALVGMKPAAFCEWMFRQLGARQGDAMADLFPGSGAVTRAWDLFQDASRSAGRVESRLAGATRRLEGA